MRLAAHSGKNVRFRNPEIFWHMAIAGRVLLGISSALALKLPTSATGPLGGKLSPSFSLPRGKNVILFDGVCNFCNRWVNFVLGERPARTPRHAPRRHS